ncbi:MAG: DUF932 domain-containing protein [Symploca sp. SIO1B1]|nr:DUF932 domain-containing protein [Symploca sp. SIO2D2]NER97562.1 DUF932 domain-containing protein [Symploca sp. SIO1B1]
MLSESQKLFRGVGTEIKPGMEIEEILERGKLNWKVEVQEFQYDTPLGLKNSKDYSTFVAYRSDTGDLLTTIGQGWKPFQNHDLVKNFLEFCDRSNLQPDWIGFLPRKRGARSHVAPNMLFISAKIPEEEGGVFHIDTDDVINSRVVFYNHHFYSFGCGCYLLTCREICTNGMTLTSKETSRMLSHIQSHVGDAEKVRESLDKLKRSLQVYNDNLTNLADIPLEPEEALAILIRDFGYMGKPLNEQPKIVQTCLMLFLGELDDELKDKKGINLGSSTLAAYRTAYGLLQSVTAYRTHMVGTGSATTHITSMLNGDSAKVVNKSYRSLLKLSRSLETSTTINVQNVRII